MKNYIDYLFWKQHFFRIGLAIALVMLALNAAFSDHPIPNAILNVFSLIGILAFIDNKNIGKVKNPFRKEDQDIVSTFPDDLRLHSDAKFERGQIVVIKNTLVGVVLSGYKQFDTFIYRIVIDSKEASYRMLNHPGEESQDKYLFEDDHNTLLYHTESIGLIESVQKDIVDFDEFIGRKVAKIKRHIG